MRYGMVNVSAAPLVTVRPRFIFGVPTEPIDSTPPGVEQLAARVGHRGLEGRRSDGSSSRQTLGGR